MENIDLRKHLHLLEKKETLTEFGRLVAKKYWGMELTIPILVKPLRKTKFGHYVSEYIRNEEGKVIGHTPIAIEINSIYLSKFTKYELMDLIKHEVCHYACEQKGKPYTDGSKYFERELMRINAATTYIHYGKGFRERSRKVQREILKNKKKTPTNSLNKLQSSLENIQIYRIYKEGMDWYQLDAKTQKMNKVERISGYWSDFKNYQFSFLLTFDVNGINYTSQIHQKKDGKWAFKIGRHGIYQTKNYNEKLFLDRKSTLYLKERFIDKAKQSLQVLTIN